MFPTALPGLASGGVWPGRPGKPGKPESLARSGCRVTSVRLTGQPAVPEVGVVGVGGFVPLQPLVWGNPGAHESGPPDLGVRGLSSTRRGCRKGMLPTSAADAGSKASRPLSPTAIVAQEDCLPRFSPCTLGHITTARHGRSGPLSRSEDGPARPTCLVGRVWGLPGASRQGHRLFPTQSGRILSPPETSVCIVSRRRTRWSKGPWPTMCRAVYRSSFQLGFAPPWCAGLSFERTR